MVAMLWCHFPSLKLVLVFCNYFKQKRLTIKLPKVTSIIKCSHEVLTTKKDSGYHLLPCFVAAHHCQSHKLMYKFIDL